MCQMFARCIIHGPAQIWGIPSLPYFEKIPITTLSFAKQGIKKVFACKANAFSKAVFSEVVLLLLIGSRHGRNPLNTVMYVLAKLHYSPQNIPKRLFRSDLNLSQGRNFTISLGICFSRLKGRIRKPFPSAAWLLSLLLVHKFCSDLLKLPVVSSCPRLPWLRSLSLTVLTVLQMPFIEGTSWSTWSRLQMKLSRRAKTSKFRFFCERALVGIYSCTNGSVNVHGENGHDQGWISQCKLWAVWHHTVVHIKMELKSCPKAACSTIMK